MLAATVGVVYWLGSLLGTSETYDLAYDAYTKGTTALEKKDYATARLHFERAAQLADRVELDAWKRVSDHTSVGGIIGKLKRKRLPACNFRSDVEDLKSSVAQNPIEGGRPK